MNEKTNWDFLRQTESIPELPQTNSTEDVLQKMELVRYDRMISRYEWYGIEMTIFNPISENDDADIKVDFPTRRAYTKAEKTINAAAARGIEAIRRYIASYPKNRQKLLQEHEKYSRMVPIFERKHVEALKEYWMAVQTAKEWIDTIEEFRQTHADLDLPYDRQFFEYYKSIEPFNKLKEEVDAHAEQHKRKEQELLEKEGQRQNPEPSNGVVFIGYAEQFTVRNRNGNSGRMQGRFPIIWDSVNRRLYLVDSSIAKRKKGDSGSKKAKTNFTKWHHYEPDSYVYEIEWPDEKQSRKVGRADEIIYSSDKLMKPQDRKGKEHKYRHQFDKGKRPVYVKGEKVVVIENVDVDERGILN